MRYMTRLIILLFSFCFATILHADNNLQEIQQDISDSMITAKITAKFANNHALNLLKIKVKTIDGVVTLSGHVKDKQTFVDALRLAKNTKGVKTIKVDKLVINPNNTPFTDAYITAKVETAILQAKVLDDESIPLVGINAVTNNGKVTLSGQVKSDKSILAIIRRVNAIKGVKEIVSQLKVNKESS